MCVREVGGDKRREGERESKTSSMKGKHTGIRMLSCIVGVGWGRGLGR